MDKQLQRVELMIGVEGIKRLKDAKVLIVGIGGVGGYAAEALARSGVGHLVLMDHDTVSISNLNRQIIATYQSIDQTKAILMKERIASFSTCKVDTINSFYDENSDIIDRSFDYVIDACDTLSAKMAIIEKCHELGVKCISSLGMANRLDPSKIIHTKLSKTTDCPLAKALRQLVNKKGIKYDIPVIISQEIAFKQNKLVDPDGKTMKDKYPPASMIFVPAAAGLLLASIVARDIIQ